MNSPGKATVQAAGRREDNDGARVPVLRRGLAERIPAQRQVLFLAPLMKNAGLLTGNQNQN